MKFSVLMSVYSGDSPCFFDLSIESIWSKQIASPEDIVIVRDGFLPEDLESVLLKWKSIIGEKLNLINISPNEGLGKALSIGLTRCKHELVARMDADDIAVPERFLLQLEWFSQNNFLDVVGSNAWEIDNSGRIQRIREMPTDHNDIIKTLWACPLLHPTVMFKKEKIISAGNYNPSLRRRQDYELWFRCAEMGYRFANIPQPLLKYRFDRDGHNKQAPGTAWQQGIIGYRGCESVAKSLNVQVSILNKYACFIPFFRSLLPRRFQNFMDDKLSPFDPRSRTRLD